MDNKSIKEEVEKKKEILKAKESNLKAQKNVLIAENIIHEKKLDKIHDKLIELESEKEEINQKEDKTENLISSVKGDISKNEDLMGELEEILIKLEDKKKELLEIQENKEKSVEEKEKEREKILSEVDTLKTSLKEKLHELMNKNQLINDIQNLLSIFEKNQENIISNITSIEKSITQSQTNIDELVKENDMAEKLIEGASIKKEEFKSFKENKDKIVNDLTNSFHQISSSVEMLKQFKVGNLKETLFEEGKKKVLGMIFNKATEKINELIDKLNIEEKLVDGFTNLFGEETAKVIAIIVSIAQDVITIAKNVIELVKTVIEIAKDAVM